MEFMSGFLSKKACIGREDASLNNFFKQDIENIMYDCILSTHIFNLI